MIISKSVTLRWNPANIEWYTSKGYIYNKGDRGKEFEVKIEDLSTGSKVNIVIKCDCKDCTTPIVNPVLWTNYVKCVKEDGKYYCRNCSIKLFGIEKHKKTRLKNGKSFEQWCIESNNEDVLDRWDYNLNDGTQPKEINYGTNKKYYFKCPKGLHESELKDIANFTSGQEGSMQCIKCSSFAQFLINTYGENALELYWDYENNLLNPWEIYKGSSISKIFIKCQNKHYHGSYQTSCGAFSIGNRCPYCNPSASKRFHIQDSLGNAHPEVFNVWSIKNTNSPYDYSCFSTKKAWWKCENHKHEDYKRIISNSNTYKFRCPKCQYSKGEDKINKYLTHNNIFQIPQKEFEGLVGINNGNLSYDFYLPDNNLLIEYQGEQHEKFIKKFFRSKKDFEKQQEHDKRKREYAKLNNINLLEIWYWDYDNIENILDKFIILHK